MAERVDDHHQMRALVNAEAQASSCLIVLGGPSGVNWKTVADQVGATFLIGVNGVVCGLGARLKYYLNLESWYEPDGEPPGFNDTRPHQRFITWKRAQYLTDTSNVIKVRRGGPVWHKGQDWSIRDYPNGLAWGPNMKRTDVVKCSTRVGTAAAQALHLAGILGLQQVHTVGLDLCFKGDKHHWFDYPPITKDNRYWYPTMFTQYKELDTLHFWIESAEYLATLKSKMSGEGLDWQDHSDGLLRAMGVF